MSFIPLPGVTINTSTDFKDYTLVWPSVSVGNVGQLCIDMLITTLDDKIRLVGRWHDATVLPAVANDAFTPFAAGRIVTSVEVFQCASRKLLLVQQRSPVIRGRHAEFAAGITAWARTIGVKQIVLLTSTHASTRVDKELAGDQFRYFHTDSIDRSKHTGLATSEWPWMGMIPASEAVRVNPIGHAELYGGEEHTDPELLSAPLKPRTTTTTAAATPTKTESKTATAATAIATPTGDIVRIQGGGVTRSLYNACNSSTTGVPLIGIVWYSNEGDNAHEGATLASLLLPFVDRSHQLTAAPVRWLAPPSWQHVFGAPHDPTLYL